MSATDRELAGPALVVLLAAMLVAGGGQTGVFLNTALTLALALPLVAAALFVRRGPERFRLRAHLGLLYAWALGFYLSIEWIVPATGRATADAGLLALDEALFGQTPSLSWTPGRATVSFLALCYLGYHAYLHGALLWAARDEDSSRKLAHPLFRVFTLGFLGYLLWPAQGPRSLELYTEPLAGGPITRLADLVVAHGSSVFDSFPSMHTAITLTLLLHDGRHTRRRLPFVVLPAFGLFISTVALRYHYLVDVFAGAALALVVVGWTAWSER